MTNPNEPEESVGPSPNLGSAEHVEHVDHADVVTNAVKADAAGVVGHADTIGVVHLQGQLPVSDRTRKLGYISDIARWLTVLFALAVMVATIIDKNINEDRLSNQLQSLQQQRTESDKIAANKLECVRRYQDVIDQDTEKQLILLGEFLVAITQNPSGPARDAAVKDKINELDRTNVAAREGLKAKIDYINQGTPLPCPLTPSTPPTIPRPPDATTEVSTTST